MGFLRDMILGPDKNDKEKQEDFDEFMEIQKKISNENLQRKIGQEYEILIENISFDGKYLIGRTKQDVPDIDGIIYIKNEDTEQLINQFVKVQITDVKEYDLIGKLIWGGIRVNKKERGKIC